MIVIEEQWAVSNDLRLIYILIYMFYKKHRFLQFPPWLQKNFSSSFSCSNFKTNSNSRSTAWKMWLEGAASCKHRERPQKATQALIPPEESPAKYSLKRLQGRKETMGCRQQRRKRKVKQGRDNLEGQKKTPIWRKTKA